MKNLLKYEFYKGLHNLFSYIVFAVSCGMALLFASRDYLSDPIIPGTPKNLMGVFINETADVGVAIIIIVGCYVIFSFGRELKNRCINYEMISGHSRKQIFLSRYLSTFFFSGSVMVISLTAGIMKFGADNWIKQIWSDRAYFLRLMLFICLISFSMISFCMIFSVVLKDSAKSTIITFIFLFLACYVMAAAAASVTTGGMSSAYENPPAILLIYPAYLWRWSLNPNLSIIQIFVVAFITIIWCAISFLVSNYIFCKSEWK